MWLWWQDGGGDESDIVGDSNINIHIHFQGKVTVTVMPVSPLSDSYLLRTHNEDYD